MTWWLVFTSITIYIICTFIYTFIFIYIYTRVYIDTTWHTTTSSRRLIQNLGEIPSLKPYYIQPGPPCRRQRIRRTWQELLLVWEWRNEPVCNGKWPIYRGYTDYFSGDCPSFLVCLVVRVIVMILFGDHRCKNMLPNALTLTLSRFMEMLDSGPFYVLHTPFFVHVFLMICLYIIHYRHIYIYILYDMYIYIHLYVYMYYIIQM